jgi:hypothetical protein
MKVAGGEGRLQMFVQRLCEMDMRFYMYSNRLSLLFSPNGYRPESLGSQKGSMLTSCGPLLLPFRCR